MNPGFLDVAFIVSPWMGRQARFKVLWEDYYDSRTFRNGSQRAVEIDRVELPYDPSCSKRSLLLLSREDSI